MPSPLHSVRSSARWGKAPLRNAFNPRIRMNPISITIPSRSHPIRFPYVNRLHTNQRLKSNLKLMCVLNGSASEWKKGSSKGEFYIYFANQSMLQIRVDQGWLWLHDTHDIELMPTLCQRTTEGWDWRDGRAMKTSDGKMTRAALQSPAT